VNWWKRSKNFPGPGLLQGNILALSLVPISEKEILNACKQKKEKLD